MADGIPKNMDRIWLNVTPLAIPFFRNSLLGDFFYSGVMILGFNYVQKKYLNLA